MGTTTIYRINETDRTINIAQSVNDTDESLHGAVLNTRMYTFDELMNCLLYTSPSPRDCS